jgi:hypothetical protein
MPQVLFAREHWVPKACACAKAAAYCCNSKVCGIMLCISMLAVPALGLHKEVRLTNSALLCAAAAGEGAYGKVFEGLNKHTGRNHSMFCCVLLLLLLLQARAHKARCLRA